MDQNDNEPQPDEDNRPGVVPTLLIVGGALWILLSGLCTAELVWSSPGYEISAFQISLIGLVPSVVIGLMLIATGFLKRRRR